MSLCLCWAGTFPGKFLLVFHSLFRQMVPENRPIVVSVSSSVQNYCGCAIHWLLTVEPWIQAQATAVGFVAKWHWDRFFLLSFPLSVSFHECSTIIHSSISDAI